MYLHIQGLLEEALNNALSAIDIEPRNSDANRLLKELRRQLGEKKTTELNTIRVTEKQATPPIQVSKKQDIAETTGRTTKPTESQVSNTIQDGKDKMRASTIKTPSALLRSVTECKDKGNQSVTKGDYPTALAAYSQAIVLCESSDVSSSVEPSVKLSLYYNRAHAFIKSSQYLQAQLDADTVIRETNKLLQPQSQSQSKSPVSTKVDESISRLNKNALYLKGLTLRNLGGDKLKPAEEALTELLSKDPQNASAKKELDKVRELLKLRGDSATKNGTSIKTTNNPTKSPSITSSSSPNPSHSSAEKIAKMTKAATTANTGANIGLTAVKTINKPRPIQSENLSTTTTSPVIETNAPMKAVKRTEDSLQELVNAGVVTYTGAKLSPKSVTTMNAVAERVQSPLTTAASVTSKMKPNVPPEPPKTVYELERICRGLKSHPDLFALYLSKFKSTTFKTAFKESVSPDLISSMLIALRDHCTEGVIVRVLTGFHSTDGFNMTIQVLPQGDIDVMNEIFMKLENTLEMKDETAETKDSDSDFTVEQLKNLRKMYKL